MPEIRSFTLPVPEFPGVPTDYSGSEKDLAREQLIERHLPLVTYTVTRMTSFLSTGVMELEDAIAHGVRGLINAIDNFDASKDVSFSSYATLRIRGAVIDAAREMDFVPRSQRRLMREVDNASWSLANLLGRSPTNTEIALQTGMSLDQVRSLVDKRSVQIQSLDLPTPHDEDAPAREIEDDDESVNPEAVVERKVMSELLSRATRMLKGRDRDIIDMRYNQGLPFRVIGRHFSISEARVSQIHLRILGNLRKTLQSFDAA